MTIVILSLHDYRCAFSGIIRGKYLLACADKHVSIYSEVDILIYASTTEILNRALVKLKMPLERPEHMEISCGDIWKVDSAGNVTESTFDTGTLFQSWYLTNYQPYKLAGIEVPPRRFHEGQYIQDIKGVAGYFGYSEEDIDLLLADGFTPEELEEYIYYQRY